jgi:pyruvate formate lyase activating enzyme
VPVHFSAFHPDYKMMDTPPTPPATLSRARGIALSEGLRYAYTGNVHDTSGGTTYCPSCNKPLIVRDWYEIEFYDVAPDGKCPHCATPVVGVFAAFRGQFGRRRIPLTISRVSAVAKAMTGFYSNL